MSDNAIIAVSIASILIVLIICTTILLFQREKSKQIKDSNDATTEMAKIFTENNVETTIKTPHIIAEKNEGKKRIIFIPNNSGNFMENAKKVLSDIADIIKSKK